MIKKTDKFSNQTRTSNSEETEIKFGFSAKSFTFPTFQDMQSCEKESALSFNFKVVCIRILLLF